MRMLVLILSLLTSLSTHASCKDALSNLTIPKTSGPTERLIGYLTTLLEHRVVGPEEIKRLEDGNNPISEDRVAIDSAAHVHRAEIARHLKSADQRVLLQWARQFLAESKKITDSRETANKDTDGIGQRLEFHPIYVRKNPVLDTNIDLGHDFEISSTTVTQKQWVDVMGENPSYYTKGNDSISIKVGDKYIELQPDHPVESLSWFSAIIFANEMSKRAGFTPAYDISPLSFDPNTRASEGSLNIVDGHFKFKANVIEADGYRIPSEEEYKFIMAVAKNENPMLWADPLLHGWLPDNSQGQTHPVGQLPPLLINGLPIFDFIGNIREWTSERINPSECVVFTSSISSGTLRNIQSPWARFPSIGFRLARTLKK